jgi:hypothetical protein
MVVKNAIGISAVALTEPSAEWAPIQRLAPVFPPDISADVFQNLQNVRILCTFRILRLISLSPHNILRNRSHPIPVS